MALINPDTVWYGRHPLALVLAPLGWLYCTVARLRRWAYRNGLLASYRAPVPVVVVGNLTVGGTGKTPLVLAIAEAAVARGWHPAIVTRGYGGAARDWPRRVAPGDDPVLVGDEPAMMARRRVCPVIAGPDRGADVRLAVADDRADLIICDDGLQHYRLARDHEIAVVDARRGLGNQRCLPAGPLREPPGRLARVDLVAVNGGAGPWGRYGFELEAGEAVSLARPGVARPLGAFAGRQVTAVAGIGNPQRFFDALRDLGIRVEPRPYPDHYGFTAADVQGWPAGPVLMTEKDGVKCAPFAGTDHWVCPVRAIPDPGLIEQLFSMLGEHRHRGFTNPRGFRSMDKKLLDILVCPICKGPLYYSKEAQELICRGDRLAFPIRDDIPVMLEEEARALAADEEVPKP